MDWMKDFYVWDSKDEGNTCVLSVIQKVKKTGRLSLGIDLLPDWPSDAYFPMDPDFPRNIALADNLQNFNSVAVISTALRQFLEGKSVTNTQFLPVGIMNHKGKLVVSKYFIVNLIHPQDCLDVKNSEPVYYNIAPTEVRRVKRLVLDPEKISPEVSIFRVKNFGNPIVVRAELANEIVVAGFSGLAWKNPLEYKG
ncbi:MAG: hypothetical protein H8K07_08665 [Nitrospira sp.]|jgi:hypothetical protein|nr:hypothetical protein [Nitrospira sp.]MDI3462577.1 hypothetical protein [Nitrospira sp.]